MPYVKLGNVRPFPNAEATKSQAMKVLEEAAEVVESVKRGEPTVDEIADCITACVNLAAGMGVTDMTPHLAKCEERNRMRGRYAR